MLALLTVLSMSITASAAYDFKLNQDILNDETYTLGDINGDGAVNAMDSLALKMTIAGIP